MKDYLKYYSLLLLKGIAMGTANIIPGVSGGTIALLTGIFEKLIDSLKHIDFVAVKLLFTGKFREFEKHLNFFFMLAVFGGVGISIFSLAKLLNYLFNNFEIYTWSFFFGLILASVYYVAKTIERWNFGTILFFIIGTSFAAALSIMNPATENESFIYLILCGMVAVCSMILPGISGSFILILMGNYKLIFIDSIINLNLMVLLPVGIGAVVGLIVFSHFLSWIFKKFRNITLSVLSGFILGSLGILWPWKDKLYLLNNYGNEVLNSKGQPVITGYHHFLPNFFSPEVIIALLIMLVGFITIWSLERPFAQKPA